MSPHELGGVSIALAVVKTLLLVVGGLITFLAAKAYRRTGQRPLALLAGGFAFVTLGIAMAGVLFEVLTVDLAIGILLESVLVLIGFALIAYSLYMQ